MSEDYYIFGREFHQKWLSPRPMTEGQKADYDSKQKIKRAREIIENYDEIVEFVGDLEESGLMPDYVTRLNAALGKLNRFKVAAEMGIDAAEAADEVHDLLMEWYATAYAACKTEEEAGGEDYYACVARVDRRWQATNVKATLNLKDGNSVARKTWEKWKARLLKTFTP